MKFTSYFHLFSIVGSALALQNPILGESPLLALHRQLIELPSVSGNERDVGLFLENHLKSLNLTVEIDSVDDNRFNLYAYKGSTRNTTVLLTSHIDTVPPYFPYRREHNVIYGRGAVDAKNCVASQVTAFDELWADGEISEGDVALLFVVGEENSGDGMRHASDNLGIESWKSVIFGEPTEGKLGVGHKGIAVAHYRVNGKAAHSAYPELGVSANAILVDALYKLQRVSLPYSDLLGNSTLNIGQISGGVAANVIPAEAEAVITVRVANDAAKVEAVLTNLADSTEHLELTYLLSKEPVFCDYKVPGFDTIALSYGTDIPNLTVGNHSTYLYGSGSIHVAHSAEEYVTVDDLNSGVNGYKKLVKYVLDQN